MAEQKDRAAELRTLVEDKFSEIVNHGSWNWKAVDEIMEAIIQRDERTTLEVVAAVGEFLKSEGEGFIQSVAPEEARKYFDLAGKLQSLTINGASLEKFAEGVKKEYIIAINELAKEMCESCAHGSTVERRKEPDSSDDFTVPDWYYYHEMVFDSDGKHPHQCGANSLWQALGCPPNPMGEYQELEVEMRHEILSELRQPDKSICPVGHMKVNLIEQVGITTHDSKEWVVPYCLACQEQKELREAVKFYLREHEGCKCEKCVGARQALERKG